MSSHVENGADKSVKPTYSTMWQFQAAMWGQDRDAKGDAIIIIIVIIMFLSPLLLAPTA